MATFTHVTKEDQARRGAGSIPWRHTAQVGLLTLFGLLSTSCRSDAPTPARASKPPATTSLEIRASLHPLHTSVASTVVLCGDGTLELVKFEPNLLTVQEKRQGRLPQAEINKMLAHLRQPAFAAALRPVPPSLQPIEGDVYSLSISAPKTGPTAVPSGKSSGVVERAPAPISQLLNNLFALAQRQAPAKLDAAFLRSESVPADVWPEIRADKRLKVLSLTQLPQAARDSVKAAISRPYSFVPLSQPIYNQLSAISTEIFITEGEKGHQLSLWSGVAATPKK